MHDLHSGEVQGQANRPEQGGVAQTDQREEERHLPERGLAYDFLEEDLENGE